MYLQNAFKNILFYNQYNHKENKLKKIINIKFQSTQH